MLDSVETDACYFSLPPFAHTGAETEAASRGIHIFVEKPVCMDMETGLATKEVLDKTGAISGVGYQTRYNRHLNAVREFVKDKTIGMAVTERWGGIAGGPSHWWRVMEKSGGMLHEQATHQLDMLRFCAGDVSEVFALHAHRINNAQENHDIPDAEVVTLQFMSGAVGYITTTSALIKGRRRLARGADRRGASARSVCGQQLARPAGKCRTAARIQRAASRVHRPCVH